MSEEESTPKTVPLVVYRMGHRLNVGEAEVAIDSVGVHVTARITDPEIDSKLREPLGAISIGLVPPVSYGSDYLTKEKIEEILETPSTKFHFEFKKPLFVDRPKYESATNVDATFYAEAIDVYNERMVRERGNLPTNDAELPDSPYDYADEDPNSPS